MARRILQIYLDSDEAAEALLKRMDGEFYKAHEQVGEKFGWLYLDMEEKVVSKLISLRLPYSDRFIKAITSVVVRTVMDTLKSKGIIQS